MCFHYFHLINNSFFCPSNSTNWTNRCWKEQGIMKCFIVVRNLSSLIQRLFFSSSFPHPAVILLKLSAQCLNLSEPSVPLSGIEKKGFINSLTNSKAKFYTSKTTLGIVFDDPKDPSAIADKILHHFIVAKVVHKVQLAFLIAPLLHPLTMIVCESLLKCIPSKASIFILSK